MTDEEIAEQFAATSGLEITCSLISAKDKSHAYRLGRYEGFLAGLNEGRLKWHKVADGDLPPEDTDVLALLADREIYMAHFYRRNVWDKIGPVIAWCEIPQYTEE